MYHLNSCLWSFGKYGGIFALDMLEEPLGKTVNGLHKYFSKLRKTGKVRYIKLTKYLAYIKYR